MIARHIPRFLAAAVVAASGVSASVLASAIPSASADPCPDLQVVFARGTDDPPGVGPTGQAFIDSLRPRVGAKSLDVYSVNYPATHEPEPPLLWSPRLGFSFRQLQAGRLPRSGRAFV
jgi:hypothetical protein